jgi:hypothetical protein
LKLFFLQVAAEYFKLSTPRSCDFFNWSKLWEKMASCQANQESNMQILFAHYICHWDNIIVLITKMPFQPTITQIRLENIIICLNAAVPTLAAMSERLKTPFLGPIVTTMWSLLSVVKVTIRSVGYNLDCGRFPLIKVSVSPSQLWLKKLRIQNCPILCSNIYFPSNEDFPAQSSLWVHTTVSTFTDHWACLNCLWLSLTAGSQRFATFFVPQGVQWSCTCWLQ